MKNNRVFIPQFASPYLKKKKVFHLKNGNYCEIMHLKFKPIRKYEILVLW